MSKEINIAKLKTELPITSREELVEHLKANDFPESSIEPWLNSQSQYAAGRTPAELCDEGQFELVAAMGDCYLSGYNREDFLSAMKAQGVSQEVMKNMIAGNQAQVISLEGLRRSQSK